VTANRNELCDTTHDLVISKRLILPRENEELKIYKRQMRGIAKRKIEEEETGNIFYSYFVCDGTAKDHYRHATNFAWLAFQEIGVSSGGSYGSSMKRRKPKPSSKAWT